MSGYRRVDTAGDAAERLAELEATTGYDIDLTDPAFAFVDGYAEGHAAAHKVNKLLAAHLVYLLKQYDHLVQAHDLIVMDTPEDRELHSRVVAEFRKAAEPVRRLTEEPTP